MTYTAKQGETFDGIAYKLWGGYAGADVLYKLNPAYAGVVRFDGGEKLTLPSYDPQTANTLPPWRR